MKRKNKGKLITITTIFIIFMLFATSLSYAHSGKTDANGGHKDNQNKSGLGSYHYHCGGYPAHLHPNGVCPYKSGSSSSKSSSSSSSEKSSTTNKRSNSNTTTTTTTNKTATPKIEVDSISIADKNSNLRVGDSIVVKANISPDNATSKTVTWTSSDSSVITIDSEGNLKTLKEGKAIIKATSSNEKSDSVEITVYPLVESIELNKNIGTIETGTSTKIGIKVTPLNAKCNLKWSSNNEDVLSIDSKGNITTKKAGRADITVETDNGKKDTVQVVVKNADIINKTTKNNKDENAIFGGLAVVALGVGGLIGYKKLKK